MAIPSWQLSGNYSETCSCDYLCPCAPTNMEGRPTKGHCDFAMVFEVEKGRFDKLNLDGLNFAVVGRAPDVMGKGNWAVGLIVDERANSEQVDALTKIATGQAGGPPAILTGVVGKFLGIEKGPIRVKHDGMKISASIPKLLDQNLAGVPSMVDPTQPLYIDNTGHPANSRLALAKATASHLHAFDINWDDDSGNNNGHFAPFNWRSA
jgi:hypothetical protein